MGHDPNLGHWVSCLGREPIYKNICFQYIIIYIIRLRLKFNNTIIKSLIGSWYIFKLKVVKKSVTMKKSWEPLILYYHNITIYIYIY